MTRVAGIGVAVIVIVAGITRVARSVEVDYPTACNLTLAVVILQRTVQKNDVADCRLACQRAVSVHTVSTVGAVYEYLAGGVLDSHFAVLRIGYLGNSTDNVVSLRSDRAADLIADSERFRYRNAAVILAPLVRFGLFGLIAGIAVVLVAVVTVVLIAGVTLVLLIGVFVVLLVGGLFLLVVGVRRLFLYFLVVIIRGIGISEKGTDIRLYAVYSIAGCKRKHQAKGKE